MVTVSSTAASSSTGIHAGVPRISPSLLSRRLSELERAGLVKRGPARKGLPRSCMLTPAGQELAPIIDSLAVWGQRWSRDMKKDDLDIAFLAWSMHRNINNERMPPGRTVIEFQFRNAPPDGRQFWLVPSTDADMCLAIARYDGTCRCAPTCACSSKRGAAFAIAAGDSGRAASGARSERACKHSRAGVAERLAPHPRLRNGREHRLAAACGNA